MVASFFVKSELRDTRHYAALRYTVGDDVIGSLDAEIELALVHAGNLG
jgi:hypothetical protein